METRTHHVKAPPGTLGGAHAAYYEGNEALDRLTTQFNMAGVLDDMGEWMEARRMYEDVIAGRTHELGAHDPATLDAKWYLAMMLMDDVNQWGASLRLWREVASGYAATYGCCHRNTNAARWCCCCCILCRPVTCCCDQPGEINLELLDMRSTLSGAGVAVSAARP